MDKSRKNLLKKELNNVKLILPLINKPKALVTARRKWIICRGTALENIALFEWQELWEKKYLERKLQCESLVELHIVLSTAPPGKKRVKLLREKWITYHRTQLRKKHGIPATYKEAKNLIPSLSEGKKYVVIEIIIKRCSTLEQWHEILSEYELHMDSHLLVQLWERHVKITQRTGLTALPSE